ncbi:hypothetical protein EDEG_01587 [Edhazardia aedis USNM 41457]|uniref:Uncharacterized protein n=1 Tax=Edhazardia aedis (strain USNM 41457) TaxID=1003232 RepID=J9DS39_EDHAE|nr:hypothetical protein EDEG_01587 [Edhazardia aedis USNM 41457]|eukprot:EJW04107.1 hypothetical protein EDEG_01587 [Edhazardia aedis USNM 41457]
MRYFAIFLFFLCIFKIIYTLLPIFFDEIESRNPYIESQEKILRQDNIQKCDFDVIYDTETLFWNSIKHFLEFEIKRIYDCTHTILDKKLLFASKILLKNAESISRVLKTGNSFKNQIPESSFGKKFHNKVFFLFSEEKEFMKKTLLTFFSNKKNQQRRR